MNIKKLILFICMFFVLGNSAVQAHGGQGCCGESQTTAGIPTWLNTPTGFAFFLIVLAPIARTWSDIASDYIKEQWINKKIKNRNRKESTCCGGHSHA